MTSKSIKYKTPSTRIRFHLKMQLFFSVSASTRSVFRPFLPVHTKMLERLENVDTADGAWAFTSKMSPQDSKACYVVPFYLFYLYNYAG